MKIMYTNFFKLVLITVLFSIGVFINAQEEDKVNPEWFHNDFSTTNIYGVGDDAAREFLQSKGLKPTQIIVAVLDSGVEIDHPDLKENIWTNSDEIAGNGIDDDKNGYIDDVHGWDFIGGKDGKDVDFDTMESTRIVKQYQDVFEGTNEKQNLKNQKSMAAKYEMYLEAKKSYKEGKEETSGVYAQLQQMKMISDSINYYLPNTNPNQNIDAQFAANIQHPELKDLFGSIAQQTGGAMTFGALMEEIDVPEDVVEYYEGRAKYNYNLDYDPRPIVGDNYADVNQKGYGNNEVEGPDASHGTHVSGIIAAVRNNNEGINGIAGDVAKIMPVRTVPNGDERDKDVANAILYAVDNGAKILNMSFGKPFSPEKEAVDAAILYAQKNNVLLVHGSGNDDENIDNKTFYPNVYSNGKPIVNNFINVGASTINNAELKASFSNFGKKQVDIFAPGQDIYATYTDYSYKYLDGTSMASPAVAGCAALLWAYFPKLTAPQVKAILMQSVNTSKDLVMAGSEDNKVSFTDLSVSGGVIDVNKAVRLAYEKYPQAANK